MRGLRLAWEADRRRRPLPAAAQLRTLARIVSVVRAGARQRPRRCGAQSLSRARTEPETRAGPLSRPFGRRGEPAACAPPLSRATALPPVSNSCTSCLKCRTETERQPLAVAATSRCATRYRVRLASPRSLCVRRLGESVGRGGGCAISMRSALPGVGIVLDGHTQMGTQKLEADKDQTLRQ